MFSGFQFEVESNNVCYWGVQSVKLKTLIRCTHVLFAIRGNTASFIQAGVKHVARVWHCCQDSPRLTLLTCSPAFETVPKFTAFDIGYMFPRVWNCSQVCPVWNWLHVSTRLKLFPGLLRLTSVTCFLALETVLKFAAFETGYMFQPRLKLFPSLQRLTLVTCFPAFPAFDTSYMFLRVWTCFQVSRVWHFENVHNVPRVLHWLHVSPPLKLFPRLPRLTLVTCFSGFDTDYVFSHVWLSLQLSCDWKRVPYFSPIVMITSFPVCGKVFALSPRD